MNGELLLDVKNIGLRFARSYAGTRRMLAAQIVETALGLAPKTHDMKEGDFWALKDISFQLHRGETIALLGLNGAGKSTLLRILYRLLLPDEGEVDYYGQVAGLIELGAGMKAVLTGHENIYVKGGLMGKTRQEIDALYQDIVDFSELGEFIHAPLATYSSGMRLRLGFSIAVCVKPDILLIDEIMAVGDHSFRKKCEQKLEELRDGAGVLFASHSIGMLQKICQKGLVLDKGQIKFYGPIDSAIDHHLRLGNEDKFDKIIVEPDGETEQAFWGRPFFKKERIKSARHTWCDEDGNSKSVFYTNEEAYFDLEFKLSKTFSDVVVGLSIWTDEGERITAISSDLTDNDVFLGGEVDYAARLKLPAISLNPGNYVSTLAIMVDGNLAYKQLNDPISVTSRAVHAGFVTPAHSWERCSFAKKTE